MFNLFKSRPPIIIINNEAEQPAALPAPKEKTWWEKHAVQLSLYTAIIFLAVLVLIVYTLRGIQENGTKANEVLLQQLHISDSLFSASLHAHYQDSVLAQLHYQRMDSINTASFQKMLFKLETIEQKNRSLQQQYRQSLELMKAAASK